MAVVGLDDIINRLEILNTEESKDLYISLLEDLNDSFGGDNSNAASELLDLESRIAELETKLAETEMHWKNKYIERFKEGRVPEEEKKEEIIEKIDTDGEMSEKEIAEEWKK